MTDAVSEVHNLSSTEEDLINSIKEILDKGAVESTQFRWGHRYGNKELTSVTDKLKAEISKRHTVNGIAVSKFNQGVRMHEGTMIIALEPSTLTMKSGTSITLDNGSYVYIFGDPSLSSSNGRDYVDAVVVVLHGQ